MKGSSTEVRFEKPDAPRYLRLVTVEGNVVGKKPPKTASPQRMRLSSLVKWVEDLIASAEYANDLIERIAGSDCDDAKLLKAAAREAWQNSSGLTRRLEALSE